MKRAYTALCNTTDRDQDLDTALRWALGQVQKDQSVTVWCWDQENLPADVVATAPSVGIRIRSETPRSRGARFVGAAEGPLVAVDLPLGTLVGIEPFGYPACLVNAYVPENDERFGRVSPPGSSFERPWINAFQPECLAGPPITATDPLIADPVIEVAMRSFTAKTFGGTTMYDSRDGDCVTHGLMELRRGGHVIEPDLLFAAALRDGWKGRQALIFWTVAREVAKGVKKRPKHHFRDDILGHWHSEVMAKE